LRQRTVQLEKQIEGFVRQLQSIKRQFALIGEEVADVNELLQKGLARKQRLLALQRTEAQLYRAALIGTHAGLSKLGDF
jgi:hypothetical protein